MERATSKSTSPSSPAILRTRDKSFNGRSEVARSQDALHERECQGLLHDPAACDDDSAACEDRPEPAAKGRGHSRLQDDQLATPQAQEILSPRTMKSSMIISMDYRDRITLEPGKRSGQPCIRGMRITVKDILEYLAGGMSREEVLRDFPELELDDINAVLAFAAHRESHFEAAVS